MKNYQFLTIVVLILLGIGSTHYLISKIPEKITAKMLAIEYDKVGGMENYVKLNKIQKKQIIAGLKAYEQQNGEVELGEDNSEEGNSLKDIVSKNTNILGNKDAEITWLEYSDMECPYCKRLHNSKSVEKILKEYDGKVNFIFKQFPVHSEIKAVANICVGKLAGEKKYYEFIDKLYNGDYSGEEGVLELADSIGVDKNKFLTCIKSNEIKKQVENEAKEAQSFGIKGTPGNVIINNKTGKIEVIPGAYPYETFKEKIDVLFKK